MAKLPLNSAPPEDIAEIPALPGFDLDLRGLVDPEASISLRGDDLVIGPAFGPILTILNFVKAAFAAQLQVRLPNGVNVAADRLLARLESRVGLPVIAFG